MKVAKRWLRTYEVGISYFGRTYEECEILLGASKWIRGPI